MHEELPYAKRQREAGEALAALIAKPIPTEEWEIGQDDYFDPWEIFPSLYGTYSSEFDVLAIEVLGDLRDGTYKRSDLASEMLKEMLCTSELCDYGTSPRVCFPTPEFGRLIQPLIEQWKAWYAVQWGQEHFLTGGGYRP